MKHTGMGAVALFICALFICSCSSTKNQNNLNSLSYEELVSLAQSGDSMAQVNLGLLYEHKSIPGSTLSYGDLPLDYVKAAEYFTEAMEAGNMKAPRHLGLLYKTGTSDGSFLQDDVKAASLFKTAMERGDSTGTLLYADCLFDGVGVEKNEEEALSLYEQLVKTKAHDKDAAALRLRGIRDVSTIAESFGDGEKVSTVIIEYAKDIDSSSLSATSFAITGRSVESVVTNNVAEKTSQSVAGHFVIINLAYENKWETAGANQFAGPKHDDKKDSGAKEGAENGPRFDDDGVPVDVSATVTQTEDISATDGTVFKASKTSFVSTSARELVIEDFEKQYFSDSETGITLPYFVYLPKDYSTTKKYPLVFFIPDASADTSIEMATLTQGNGATVWATAQEQSKHPAIVVAVQYPYSVVKEAGPLTTDDYEWTTGLTAVDNLLHFIIKNYAVDESRIYGTGQSQGCMSNIALSDKYPDLFAAQFLVAGQWNVEEMAAMKDKKLWIIVCEGDTKAYPSMSAAVDLWKQLGAKVARGDDFWNPKADDTEMSANVKAMLAKDANIRMNVFADGSHMYTWSLAYNIEGIRDWLFAQ